MKRDGTCPPSFRHRGGKGNKMVAVGDKFPNVTLQKGPFPPEGRHIERLAGKTVVVDLPGAFTPT